MRSIYIRVVAIAERASLLEKEHIYCGSDRKNDLGWILRVSYPKTFVGPTTIRRSTISIYEKNYNVFLLTSNINVRNIDLGDVIFI